MRGIDDRTIWLFPMEAWTASKNPKSLKSIANSAFQTEIDIV
jgi:hypothetical protein